MSQAAWPRHVIRPALKMLFLLAVGCSAAVEPPAHCASPTAVIVADYGKHSSLTLPSDRSHYVEYSFGDWNYYALERHSPFDAAQALFFSPASTLGRRDIAIDPAHATLTFIGKPRLLALRVEREKVVALRTALAAEWNAQAATHHFDAALETDFVKETRPYNWLENCNGWTASRLRDLGCKIEGTPILSHFALLEPKAEK